jgi:hypothetical protein
LLNLYIQLSLPRSLEPVHADGAATGLPASACIFFSL